MPVVGQLPVLRRKQLADRAAGERLPFVAGQRRVLVQHGLRLDRPDVVAGHAQTGQRLGGDLGGRARRRGPRHVGGRPERRRAGPCRRRPGGARVVQPARIGAPRDRGHRRHREPEPSDGRPHPAHVPSSFAGPHRTATMRSDRYEAVRSAKTMMLSE
ncbi:hypothetical protein E6W39_26020 [Kitasatospora acidiphila]|uniref:Uncharacterized protein n=1 Tax=Kitasatospora acidiphila TaxID=2567942 RepID=A0A540W7R3_9ACTN|nr:hypothetical protein E6W39_26020 [Kitasatospora acidiphila]